MNYGFRILKSIFIANITRAVNRTVIVQNYLDILKILFADRSDTFIRKCFNIIKRCYNTDFRHSTHFFINLLTER